MALTSKPHWIKSLQVEAQGNLKKFKSKFGVSKMVTRKENDLNTGKCQRYEIHQLAYQHSRLSAAK